MTAQEIFDTVLAHQIIQEDDLLAADVAANINKAERRAQADADRALDLQIKFQNLPGAWA